MWRFYRSLARELPGLWKEAKSKVATALAVAVSIAAVLKEPLAFLAKRLDQPWIASLAEFWPELPSWWSSAPVILLILYGLLRINYDQHVHLVQVCEEKGKDLNELRSSAFQILFEKGAPFEQVSQIVDGTHRLFRVGVKNIGGVTIDDVKVQLESLLTLPDNARGAFTPIELRQMHDNPPPGEPLMRVFTLNPGQTQFIDVVMKRESSAPEDARIILCYAIAGVPNIIPCTRHELHIRAIGRNVMPQMKRFLVEVGMEGRLSFRPVKGDPAAFIALGPRPI